MWYPGHINKAKRKIKEYLKAVDTVLIVLDARAPFATTAFERNIFTGKNILYVLNKADLANKKYTKLWMEKIKETSPVISFSKAESVNKIKGFINSHSKKKLGETRVLIAGVPNVGKSTIINKFSGRKLAKTGMAPGITRGLQWINLGSVKLLDTPGILYSKLFNKDVAAKLLLIGSLPVESIDKYDIITRAYEIFKVELNLDKTFEEFLEEYGKKRGFISKGGNIDFERTKNNLFKAISEGKFGFFTYDKEVALWMQE
ncbi:GTP-binding protein [Thermosipho melanesiensis]|uniref:Ribosome biogenesis GTPase A n=2 Tax=Thermosipho melanesiensis TaxID=46541 RepID=A6LK99_THEM4|nr:ribosome biogenesis GTPase YlqF [Thermosipho melanesiensis]ABR30350.1 GTP-binding protein, HSR1-related [Thermosipho melanesiensis BI429]APT73516.1 GTP-binding protein [Thermosipho melanesiensis]OOC37466.1 GTP-binding protein [Thermosipho melanesiensis]OOC39671.1 GTP-binding protein [Thermosipho melanesiensis]OOC39699.1 GTP-binding protein [Thermosipho melanesiensis]